MKMQFMKTRTQLEDRQSVTVIPFKELCLNACREILARVEQTKHALLAEFRPVMGSREHLLRLAVNEAEALAWQTDYPHLIFPTLAVEKVRAVSAWDVQQQALRRNQQFGRLAA